MINLKFLGGKSGKKEKDREPKPIFGIPFLPLAAQLNLSRQLQKFPRVPMKSNPRSIGGLYWSCDASQVRGVSPRRQTRQLDSCLQTALRTTLMPLFVTHLSL